MIDIYLLKINKCHMYDTNNFNAKMVQFTRLVEFGVDNVISQAARRDENEA